MSHPSYLSYASMMQSIVVFNAMLYQRIKMMDVCTCQDYVKTVDTTAGLETLEEFELRLKEVWKKECSSDSDVDEVLLMNRSCHLTAGSADQYSPSQRVLNLDQKNHVKVSVAVIVMPLSRQGSVNEQKLSPPQSPPLLV